MSQTNEQQDAAREAIIARVRKLAKMTTENGCSEHEAIAAMSMVSRLMADYGLTQDEVSLRRDATGCITDEFLELDTRAGDWHGCIVAISKLYGTRAWTVRREEDVLDLGFTQPVIAVKYFGLPQDVAACLAMSAILYVSIGHEAERYKGTKKRSFTMGMVDRVRARIVAMMPKDADVMAAAGRGLIVLKDQLVTAEYAKLGLTLRKARYRTVRVDQKAYAAGQRAGNVLDIGGAKTRHGNGQGLLS